MSFADANTLLNAVMASANEARYTGVETGPSGMEQLFSQMMGIAMKEIQKVHQHNAGLQQDTFNAGYNAMLAEIDTSDDPHLAKIISDYRAASNDEERTAIKPILEEALEQYAEEAEQNAFDIMNGIAATADNTEDEGK